MIDFRRQIDFGLGDVQEGVRLALGTNHGFLAGKHVIGRRGDGSGVFAARPQGSKGADQRRGSGQWNLLERVESSKLKGTGYWIGRKVSKETLQAEILLVSRLLPWRALSRIMKTILNPQVMQFPSFGMAGVIAPASPTSARCRAGRSRVWGRGSWRVRVQGPAVAGRAIRR